MTRAIWIASLASVLAFGAFAQQKDSPQYFIAQGNRFFEQEQFNLAIQFFQQANETSTGYIDADYKLAESYRRTFNYKQAEIYYYKVFSSGDKNYPLAHYYYALMLKLNESFDESVTYFSSFIELYSSDNRLSDFVEQAYIDRAGSESWKNCGSCRANKVEPMTGLINTPYNDYAPAVIDSSRLVFTSGRILSNRQLIDERYGEAFSDNFYLEQISGQWIDNTKHTFNAINSRYNDGSGSFNRKADKYYFTVCGGNQSSCKIYVSHLKNARWQQPVLLNENINIDSYESKQPAISPGGDTLFFVSNRPAGFGGFDIWMSVDSGTDNWGPAINLGKAINTKLNELSPAVTPLTNLLLFASDGHEGFGGLDLYMAKRLSSQDTVVYNLEDPFNSTRDDCFLTLGDKQAYWSSNRDGGVGGFDIYALDILSKISFVSKISLKKQNSRRDLKLRSKQENTEILTLVASRQEDKMDYNTLTYEKKKIVDKLVEHQINGEDIVNDFQELTNDEFNVLCQLAADRLWSSLTTKADKTILGKIKSLSDSSGTITIAGILRDSISGSALRDKKINLEAQGQVIKVTYTNEEGKFRFTDVPPNTQLLLRLEDGSIVDQVNPMIEMDITTSERSTVVYAENIYFDFDHSAIRPEAAKVLDELASYLISNEGVQVEIFAFADDVGSDEYNLYLTGKRGQAVADYLTKKGVDATSLAITAKGKQGNVPTRIERQYNRRVEFYLNGSSVELAATTKTYILRRQAKWTLISDKTGVSEEELKSLNGTASPYLKPFQPVRLPLNAKGVSPELFFVGI